MAVLGKQYRNQTALHEWLTSKTLPFLSQMATARGIVWRQEHTIHNGMRPDAVAFCELQMKYERKFNCVQRDNFTWKDEYNHMFVFETKVSYSDFKNSFNGNGQWKEQSYANFHFLVIPKGFYQAYDLSNLPDYWGILEPNVSALKIVQLPKYISIDRIFFLEAAYTILFKWGRTLNLIERELLNKD
ncbi:hypothetical protein D4R42_00890 [bacterium]|nr:MAG: hypothetical protein D4R42_00890 [bacterium]